MTSPRSPSTCSPSVAIAPRAVAADRAAVVAGVPTRQPSIANAMAVAAGVA